MPTIAPIPVSAAVCALGAVERKTRARATVWLAFADTNRFRERSWDPLNSISRRTQRETYGSRTVDQGLIFGRHCKIVTKRRLHGGGREPEESRNMLMRKPAGTWGVSVWVKMAVAFALGMLLASSRFMGGTKNASRKFIPEASQFNAVDPTAEAAISATDTRTTETDVAVSSAQQSGASHGLTPEFNTVDFSKADCAKFPSQHGEDRFLYNAFWSLPKPMTNGVFLELGALDGVWMSNTWWFEQCLGWNGVLIEGHPTAIQKLLKNRPNAHVLGEAVCAEESTIDFVGRDDGVSGDVSQMPDSFIQQFHRGWDKGRDEVHKVKCGPLNKKLEKLGVTHIDFWTLDVEGAEWSVLNTFDWEAVSIHVLVIENDKDEAVEKPRRHELLKSKNFELRGTLVNNELWVNPKNARPGMEERVVMFDGSAYMANGIEKTD